MIKDKILNRDILKNKIDVLKRAGKKIVFTNGCFDIIHYGHAQYLEDAKKEGDILIVAVNSDSSVKRLKGDARPIVNEDARMAVIAALCSVDFVTIFNEDTPLETIKLLLPDVLVKGGDWKEERMVGNDVVKANGGTVKAIPFVKGFSTTSIVEKIKQSA